MKKNSQLHKLRTWSFKALQNLAGRRNTPYSVHGKLGDKTTEKSFKKTHPREWESSPCYIYEIGRWLHHGAQSNYPGWIKYAIKRSNRHHWHGNLIPDPGGRLPSHHLPSHHTVCDYLAVYEGVRGFKGTGDRFKGQGDGDLFTELGDNTFW